jgi:hypothetical protein
MPDGQTEGVYGFESRDAASEWIDHERRNWLASAEPKRTT